jgi:hypothetical protein
VVQVALALVVVVFVTRLSARAAGDSGRVTFNGLPVPGATITATRDGRTVVATSDDRGDYVLPGVDDGQWTIHVDMIGFVPVEQQRVIAATTPPAVWSLEMLPLAALERLATPETPIASAPAAASAPPADAAAAAGLVVTGSVNNGAASPFSQSRAFGNDRRRSGSQYNGGVSVAFGNSRFDAAPFSFTADRRPKPAYHDARIGGTFGGPLKIPGVASRPVIFVGYQHSDDNQASTLSAEVPTIAERLGQFDGPIVDPATGQRFAGNSIPASRISPQAAALLALYPLPNVTGDPHANFQRTSVADTGRDAVQVRWSQSVGAKTSVTGTLNSSRTVLTTTDLFGFTDATTGTTTDATVDWSYRVSPLLSIRAGYHLTRQSTRVAPAFASQVDVEGEAGITGASEDPATWGPPALAFASGIASLRDAQFAHNGDTTHAWTTEWVWRTHHGHAVTFGGGASVRRLGVNTEQDPRGTFGFDGSATGNDLADFLLGLPRSVSMAFGNGNTRYHGQLLDAYVSDDWRVRSSLTLNLGVRWEYESPLDELDGRVVNLAVTGDFAAVSPVIGAALARDWRGIEPRLSTSWRPIGGSSVVIRAGYGVYRNTNVYQGIAMLLAQQPPLSRAFTAESTASEALTLATGLVQAASSSGTFAVDPRFRVSDAQNWQASIQRDLPLSLTATITYLGTKGSHLMREFLPNTYPNGAANPCPACPTGFVYLTSDGSSRTNALQIQVRRRLRNGFSGLVQYTLSKATDNAAAFTTASLSGAAIAQNWQDLGAEYGRSSFDQRHLVTAQADYVGHGWLHDWAFTAQFSRGSGFPLTPVVLVPVVGTGVLGTVRPDLTSTGFAAPAAGAWGTAPRNSLPGPPMFALDAGAGRLLPLKGRATLEWRVDATNVLNRVTYASYETTFGSPQFGLPNRANPMRKVQSTLRVRF